ncbi:MAG: DnaA/Hda family protein [Elusimicrobia bacterium]|nr:DnaA/Hda family protein [Elusimicrobiota bacterium]
MIAKWDIQPVPIPNNKERHKLFVKGDMTDIFFIIKKLGHICSRPEKSKGDFNFVIYLSKMNPEIMLKLKQITTELSKLEKQEASIEIFEQKVKPIDNSAFKKEKAQTEKAKAETASSSPSASMRGLSIPSRTNRQQINQSKEESISVEISSKQFKKKKEESIRKKKLLQTKWSMELPMIPVYNFENFVAGSHNRFAHAAAMAVVENPGVMYNPLLIFGIPGTGKTHFIHSIAYGLAKSLGHQSIFVTDGIKLSRGLDLAIRDGLTDRLEEIFSQVKALVIDDIHLLMLAERNKKFLSKLMNDFMSQDKQIVATSLFPPKALGGLEEQLGFQFTQGWMVDLKIPNTEKYKAIAAKMINGMNIKLSEGNIGKFFVNDMMALGNVAEILEQVKKLEKLVANVNNEISHEELLRMLLGDSADIGDDLLEDDINKAEEFELQEKDNWFKWGIFYPTGSLKHAKWIIYSLHEKSKELGINVEWDQIFMEEYNSDELYGIPFKIADFSSEKKVNGIIVMGPQSTSVLGAHEQEFKHLTKKILTSFFIKSGWISANQLKGSAPYVKILMDLI